MPDVWEISNNLNPENSGDAQLKSVDGIYSNVEVYLNSLVNGIVEAQNQDGIVTSAKQLPVKKDLIHAYWNNSSKEIIVNHSLEIRRISVFSISGVLIADGNFNSSSARMQVTGINPGIYIVKIIDKQNGQFSKKIMNF
jgi:hypothetical protein